MAFVRTLHVGNLTSGSGGDETVKDATNQGKYPQDVQRQYPHYIELVSDLKRTNTELSKLADDLLMIARARKQKPSRTPKVAPLATHSRTGARGTAEGRFYRIEPSGTVVVLESERAHSTRKRTKATTGFTSRVQNEVRYSRIRASRRSRGFYVRGERVHSGWLISWGVSGTDGSLLCLS